MRSIPGETKEECAQRLKREWDEYTDQLWHDHVDYLSSRFQLSEHEAEKLLEDAR